jgi:SAM-dependent methyltransferase
VTATGSCHAGVVVDRLFSEPGLAELYDVLNPWERRGDFTFYLPLVMSAATVLDVGCGTGQLLHLARQAGHTGRLCGLDPADAMLDQARARSDIEWILGDLGSVDWDQEFDLVVMTGHAFQVFVEDDQLRTSLAVMVDGSIVSFTVTYTSPRWDRPQVSRSTLRFLDKDSLSSFLSDAGLAVEEQLGDWDGQPLTKTSPEIITVARRD